MYKYMKKTFLFLIISIFLFATVYTSAFAYAKEFETEIHSNNYVRTDTLYFERGAALNLRDYNPYKLRFTLYVSPSVFSSDDEITLSLSTQDIDNSLSLCTNGILTISNFDNSGTMLRVYILCECSLDTEFSVIAELNGVVVESDTRSAHYVMERALAAGEISEMFIYEEVVYDYNTSSVIADLNNGNEVSESEFFPIKYLANIFSDNLESIMQGNFNFTQDIYVISFIENGYGTDNFGVYLYVYNPKNLDILSDSGKNKVQFSVSDKENDVFRTAYSKYSLTLIDKTENNLYYKFKVDNLSLADYSERYYAVSGIELHIDGNGNATEYSVGSIYYCMTNNKGKTTISRKPLSKIAVDCTHVYYRTDDSDKGKGWSNQLSACYFSLPKEYSFGNNPYGKLTEILAEFDLRYTKPILLLNNESVYQDFARVLGKTMPIFVFTNGLIDWALVSLNGLCFRVFDHMEYGGNGRDYVHFSWSFNVSGDNEFPVPCYPAKYKLDTLNWVFCNTTADFDNEDYYFPAENLRNYASIVKSRSIEEFNALFEGKKYFIDNELSLCGFDYGYNRHTYSISQEPEQGAVLGYELTFDKTNKNLWDKIREAFGANLTETISGIKPLVRVEYSDYNLTNAEFSEKYLVAKQQVADLKTKLALAQVNQEEVWLFRYDCSEYYGAKAEVYREKDEDGCPTGTCYDGLVCQEPVYLDWDVLSFTFEQDAVTTSTQQTKTIKTTIPVEHSPEDVYHDLTRSANDFDKGCGCADYGSMITWILLLGGVVVIWFAITKIVRRVKGR